KRKTALENSQAAATDRHCATFGVHEEDHILGNSLRDVTMKKTRKITFNLLIQMQGILPTGEVFQRSLVQREAMTLRQPCAGQV
ncbi:hypothetical protein U0070_003907, partial [Myodes glareolus]